MIYAIRAVGTPFIKIGFVEGKVGGLGRRLETLQTGCPYDLELIAQCPGDLKLERYIHNCLLEANAHQRGEWFKDCEELQTLVRRIQNNDFTKADKGKCLPMREAHKHKRLGRMLQHIDSLVMQASG